MAATWKWDVKESKCSICFEIFERPCGQCKYGGDECGIIEGECSHIFHMHCIYKAIEENKNLKCPLCRSDWKEKKY